MMDIEPLVDKSVYILRETYSQFKKVGLLASFGKDSVAMLSLCREAFFGQIPFDVIHINTGYKFPEMYAFREALTLKWGLNLKVARNLEAMANDMCPDYGRFECCTALKTEALKQLLALEHYDALVVGIRRDEHGVRGKEHIMSPRTREGFWVPYKHNPEAVESKGIVLNTDMELEGWSLFESDFGPGMDHVRVHPLLHWSELEIWEYTRDRGLPVCPLYFSDMGRRYRSLGCYPCTSPVASEAATIDDIIEELKSSRVEERSGRAQDKESENAMQKLRHLGYM